MPDYQALLLRHLAEYKTRRLGVQESGVFERNGRAYRHILPGRLRQLNILEPFRAELWTYLKGHPKVRLHQHFHHLNSSQALAFNLFFPFFNRGGQAADALTRSLGVPGRMKSWTFEHIPDPVEGTNVDVAWTLPDGRWIFCEVKLSEAGFGGAKPDARHRAKYERIYTNRLSGLIEPGLLEFHQFCQHYQLLRNVAFLSRPSVRHILFVLPSANDALRPQLRRVRDGLLSSARSRVHVALLEEVLASLRSDGTLPPELRQCGEWLTEKYVAF